MWLSAAVHGDEVCGVEIIRQVLNRLRPIKVAGTLLAVPALVGFAFSLTDSPVPSMPPLIYAGIAGGTALLGLVAIGAPTRVALRANPAEAIGARQ